jgi:hypothetical protein
MSLAWLINGRQRTERAAVNGKTEPHLLREGETTLGFALHLIEGVARREKVRIQVAKAVRRKSQVAALVCRLEGAPHQFTASPDMSRPWQDDTSEVHIGPGLEAPQPALFDQVIAEPAESKSGLIVAPVVAPPTRWRGRPSAHVRE